MLYFAVEAKVGNRPKRSVAYLSERVSLVSLEPHNHRLCALAAGLMVSVINSSAAPHHLKQLRQWFIAEWSEMDSFSGPNDGYTVPSPLLVVDDQELLGGLAFTSYPIPGSEELGLWINALIVAPEHRGNGLGSQLVQAAEVEAVQAKEEELFVYTDLVEFYQTLGWQNVDSSGERAVLRKIVSNS